MRVWVNMCELYENAGKWIVVQLNVIAVTGIAAQLNVMTVTVTRTTVPRVTYPGL